MRGIILAALVAAPGLLLCAPEPSCAQQSVVAIPSASQGPAHVSSSGHGEVRVTPDHAVVTAVIDSRSDSAAAALADNIRRYDAVLRAVQGAGISNTQISSPGYTVTGGSNTAMFGYSIMGPASVDYSLPVGTATNTGGTTPRPPNRATSSVVRRSVRVEVSRIADVDRVMAAVLAGGAKQAGVQFTGSSLASAQQAAMMAAVADARSNADAMARGAGGTLGRLLDISTSFSPFGGITSYASTRYRPGT